MVTLDDEFQRQVQTLLERDYAGAAGMTTDQFTSVVEPLRARVDDVPRRTDPTHLPFVLVVASILVPAEIAMERVVDDRGNPGLVNMTPVGPTDFTPLPGTEPATTPAYLLTDVDTGAATLNVPPREALPMIEDAGRLPLTIAEGIALLTQFPDVLRTHNAYQLLASRRADKRIPSIWTSNGRPRLGWCWEGNPHSWLGSASAAGRVT